MAINRSSDSMSRCNDLYDNKFQINSRPDLKAAPTIKDTIETSKTTEIKKEALERLTSSKYHLLQTGIMKGAKILFLTIALPPYFLFFGLPKFLIVEGLPAVVILVDWLTTKIKQKAQKPIQFFIDRTNQMMAFIKLTAQRIIRPVVQLTIQVREFFQRMRDRVYARANQLNERFKNALKMPGQLVSRLTTAVKNRISQTKALITKRALAFNDKVQEGVERLKEIPQALIAWGTVQFQKLNDYRLSIVEKSASKFQLSDKAAKACQAWISAQVNTCKKFAQLAVSPLVRLYQEGLKPALMAVANVFKNAWNKAGGFVKDRRQKTVQFLEEMRGRMKALDAQQFLDWVLTSSKMKNMPEFLRKILLAIQQNRFYKAVFGAGYWVVTTVVYYVSSAAKAVIEFVTMIYDMIAKGSRSVIAAVRNSVAVVLGYVGVGFGWINRIWNKGLYGFLLVVMMTGILIHWGFQLLGELSTKAVSKMLPSKQ